MRFYRIKTILLTILTIVFIQNAFGQMMSKGSGLAATKDMFGPALFLYKTAIFQSEQFKEKDRLDVYVAFANDILQFVKEREGNFSAEYELLISVFDKKGTHTHIPSIKSKKVIFSIIWFNEEIIALFVATSARMCKLLSILL